MNTDTVLITGASSGIGLELAREFARHGHPLVITAPVEAELRDIAEELRREHGVVVHVIARDLEDEEAAEEIFAELADAGILVDILVNNAGFGVRGKFSEITLEDDLGMLRLNIEAVVRLTKFFLPPMLIRGHGRILNTASVAGFEPGPSLAVYHATKAFVLSLSESLATELEDTGVTLTALCPGPVDTDFFAKAEMVDSRVFQKGHLMAPQEVARTGYAALMRGERLVVPGGMNKAMVFSRRFLSDSAQAKMNQKHYESVDPADITREPGEVAAKAGAKSHD